MKRDPSQDRRAAGRLPRAPHREARRCPRSGARAGPNAATALRLASPMASNASTPDSRAYSPTRRASRATRLPARPCRPSRKPCARSWASIARSAARIDSRVCVVAVVDHERGAGAGAPLQASGHTAEGGCALAHRLHGRPRAAAAAPRRPWRCEGCVLASDLRSEGETRPKAWRCASLPRPPRRERPPSNRSRTRAPGAPRSGRASTRRTRRPRSRSRCPPGPAPHRSRPWRRDRFHAAEDSHVRALRVVHQRHGGPRDACEVIDLALVVHAHLDHAKRCRAREA